MFFRKKKPLDTWEANINDTLKGVIGLCRDCSKRIVTEKDFELIDKWEKRLGFVKEDEEKTMILALRFQEGDCRNYQLVIRQNDQPWKKANLIAYKYTPGPGCF